MEKRLTFAIFLACFVIAVSDKRLANGLKGFTKMKSDVRQHFAAYRESRRVRKTLHNFRGNKENKSGSSSRIQYVHELFGLASRFLNPKMSLQQAKVSSYKITGKVANNIKDVNVISSAKRIKRSTATEPQEGEPAFLLYIVGYEIRKLTLHDGVETTLLHWKGLGDSQALYIDYHYKENRMYWADSHSIHRSFLNGSGVETIYRYLNSVSGLAVDWLGDNLYWIQRDGIAVSKTDGRFRKTLISLYQSGSDLNYDRNIALDPERGFMYWYGRYWERIESAAMCETNGENVHSPVGVTDNTHLAIDYLDQKLYWTTRRTSQIKCRNLDPAHVKFYKSVILTGLPDPISLSVYEEYIYWVDWRTRSIQRANKTDGSSRQTIKGNITQAKSLKVVHWDIQKGFDLCSTLGHCSHLCLLDPVNFVRCECPDNMNTVRHSNGTVTCVCPSGQFITLDGECRYRDAPWNVTATPLNTTAIKLTWLQPKDLQSGQTVYYIFYGIFPHAVNPWPVGRTTATTFVVSHLKRRNIYVFAVSPGLKGRKSITVKSKPTTVSPTTTATPEPTAAASCSIGWLHCQRMSSGKCIRIKSLCDGVVDCPQGWDEQPQNCPKTAPGQVIASPLNSTAVTLSWLPPTDNPSGQTVYYTYYGTVSSGVSSVPVGNTTARMFVVGNLQQNVVYVFEVSLGLTGRHSYPVYSKSKSADVDCQPVQGLKAVLVNSSSVVLTWEKPVDVTDSSDIKGYQIKMLYKDMSGAISHHYSTTDRRTNHAFKYLNFSTEYTFEVRTRFKKGDVLGVPVYVSITTEPFSASVAPLTKTIHNNTVVLTWSAPRTIDLKKSLTSYRVYRTCRWNCRNEWNLTCRDFICVDTQTVNQPRYTFPLQRSKGYSFAVHAETIFGNGENSTISFVSRPYAGDIPNLRVNVYRQTYLRTTNIMRIRWDAPSEIDAKDIQYYAVIWCNFKDIRFPHSHCDDSHKANVTGRQTWFSLDVLAGDNYKIWVHAVTTYGDDIWSTTQKILPPLDLEVKSLHAYTTGRRYGLQVHLHWHVSNTYNDRLEYEVRWHCIPGTGSTRCDWFPTYVWSSNPGDLTSTRIVNTTSFTEEMTKYDTVFVFEITIITPRGRSPPYQVSAYIAPLNGMPKNFSCDITMNNTLLMCQWSPPTDFNATGFTHYMFEYKCDDCLHSYFDWKVLYAFNETSVNVSVSRGERYTAKIQVHTRYGSGKWVQTTITTNRTMPVSIGPVTQLNASLDDHNPLLVHLSWKAPSTSSPAQFEYQINITCQDCDTPHLQIWRTGNETLSARLQCAHTYRITVRALADKGTGADSQVVVLIPSVFAPVKNLKVKFLREGSEKGFSLEWDPVKGVSGSNTTEYDILVTSKSLVLFHQKTASTHAVFVRSPDPVSGQEYTFGVACKTVCGYGERTTLTIHYPELPSPLTQPLSTLVTSSSVARISLASVLSTLPCSSTILCSCPTRPMQSSMVISSPITSTKTGSALQERSLIIASYPAPTKPPPSSTAITSTSVTPATSGTFSLMSSTTAMHTSPTKPFSSFPRIGHQKEASFPYWSIPVACGGILILVLIVVCLVRKYKRRIKYKRMVADLPYYPQDYAENVGQEDEIPLMLGELTDDEVLITA